MDTNSPAENLTRHYERIYNVEDDFRNYNLSILVSSLAHGRRVLDLGCGSGFLLDLLLKKGYKTIGIEPNEELIRLAKQRNPGLDIRKGDAEDIDSLVLDQVDTVLAVDVVEHISNDVSILKKILRHISPGGRFIVVVPAYPWLYGRRDKKYGHFKRYSKNKLENMLVNEGFRIKRGRYWNMLGVLPYIFYEKILEKELETKFREKRSGAANYLFKKVLQLWFRFIENKINLGFGLSIIIVAEKK